MDPFVQQLAELCRIHVTRPKWVFVPSHALGRTLGERLALDGTNWLNLRFVTPLDIAIRMGAPFLVERRIDPSEEGLGPALMMRLLLELPEGTGYFRSLTGQPSMAQALWSTIRELRMAGVTPAQIANTELSSTAKSAELQSLLAAYERFLAHQSRADMAAVYLEALEHPHWCPIGSEALWTELPDAIWTPLQHRLLDAIPGERVAPRTVTIPAAKRPRRSPRRFEPVTPDPEINPLAFLLAGSRAEREASIDGIHLFHAGGREAEIEEVFRRILASGAPLDEVEIACASDEHAALAWEKALRHEWPVTSGFGIPAARTRPGRALLGLCDWVETDYAASHLRRLLQSGDLGLELDDEGFTAGQAARLLGRAGAGWGSATYGITLGALRKEYASRAADRDAPLESREDAQQKAELTTLVLEWVTDLLRVIPAPDTGGGVELRTVVDGVLRFVERTTARKNAADHRAADAVAGAIAELQALQAFACPPLDALRFIRERVQSLQIAAERPRPGHLHLSTLSHACYSGRPHLFIVGLEEGRVFPLPTEDPVLLDVERTAISAALRLSTDRVDEAVFGMLARLATWSASTGGTVTFSYSCRDTREFRDTYASWLMLQAYRLQQGNGAAAYEEMKAALGEPSSIVPKNRDAAASMGGWWMRTVAGTNGSGVSVLTPAFDGIARGIEGGRARTSDAFTAYDGLVPSAGAVLDPCRKDMSLSVTELEDAAKCPFRFFLRRGLGLRPHDEREPDRDVWLDPLTRGAELHDLYAALLRRCRGERRRPSRDRDARFLTALAQSRLDELRREMPPATAEIFDRESKEFLADLQLFLEAEADDIRGSTPVALEVSFGRPLDADAEPLAQESPVEIDLGGGLIFRIAGRIDRIDKVGAAEFEIIDYKTGGFWPEAWRGRFDGGRRLQHALYGLAALALFRTQYRNPNIRAGVYYFSSRKGRRERVVIAAPSRAEVARILADLREVITRGTFAHAAREGDCRYCGYSTACDGSLEGRAMNKLQDSKLVALSRLAAHD